MKTRAGIKDDASGRATSWPSLPTCWARDRSSPHRGAPPPGAACPRAKARGCRECTAFSGAATKGSGANSRGTRRALCRHSHPSLRHSAQRVPGATPSGRPRGPHKPRATGRRGPALVDDCWARGACARPDRRTPPRSAHLMGRSRRGAGWAGALPPFVVSLQGPVRPGARRTQRRRLPGTTPARQSSQQQAA